MNTAIWKIDEAHSGMHFTVRHLVVANVHGQFRRWSAELAIEETDLTRSSIAITIDAASVETGNSERDADLRSPNFFDAERFPALTFRSRRVERAGNDTYRVVGDLTIRDITREVTVETAFGGFITDPWGGRRAGFTARASIQRSDFGMRWNEVLEAGGVVLSDRVDIGFDIEAVAQAAQQAVA
jgi:polyisoprenoid-binding protein YceI